MKTILIITTLLLLVGCATIVTKQTKFVPKYEFSGNWNCDNSREYSVTRRHGRHVVSTYNTNTGYDHIFKGDYIDGQTIEGIQTRRKRADGTTTRMYLTIKLSSPNLAKVHWIVLDGNSDLMKGQTGECVIQRVIVRQ